MNENLLKAVIANPPKVHQGDAEVGNEKALTGSSVTGYMREAVEKNLVVCHGIDSEVARFLHQVVAEGARTLETGCGLSTIIFDDAKGPSRRGHAQHARSRCNSGKRPCQSDRQALFQK